MVSRDRRKIEPVMGFVPAYRSRAWQARIPPTFLGLAPCFPTSGSCFRCDLQPGGSESGGRADDLTDLPEAVQGRGPLGLGRGPGVSPDLC
jgi:hypothetical protein